MARIASSPASWWSAGYKTRLCFEAKCFTKAPANFPGYISQQLRWRRSNIVDFITALPFLGRFHPFVVVHYVSMALLLLFYPLTLAARWRGWALSFR